MIKIPDKCLFLHASSVIVENRAFLFLGHSTAGKSTIAGLLGNKFQVLADDTVFVSNIRSNQWLVFDGKNRCREGDPFFRDFSHRNLEEYGRPFAPLAACLRIYKSEAVFKERVSSSKMAQYLLDAVMEVDLQRGPKFKPSGGVVSRQEVDEVRSNRLRWFSMVSLIARTLSGWKIWFSHESHFDDLIDAVMDISGKCGPMGSDDDNFD